jgi:hypothetical protein
MFPHGEIRSYPRYWQNLIYPDIPVTYNEKQVFRPHLYCIFHLQQPKTDGRKVGSVKTDSKQTFPGEMKRKKTSRPLRWCMYATQSA